jgi:hypothetical protein
MIIAIAAISGDPDYLEPILQTTLNGLSPADDRGRAQTGDGG